jgi:endonuclease/exonuclease/phosphatase (EEP) superfamily protein YafD
MARPTPRCIAAHALVAGITSAALIGATHLGWIGDLVAIGLPVLAVASAVLFAAIGLTRWRRWRTIPLTSSIVSLLLVFAPRAPMSTGGPVDPIRVSSVNLLYRNSDPAGAVADALADDPDLLVVSELTDATDALLTAAFPYRVVADLASGERFGQGVYSTFPLTALDRPDVKGQVLRLTVDAPTPFVLWAVHIPRPVLSGAQGTGLHDFAGHHRAIRQLDALVEAETEAPVVLAGDLNLADRTTGYRVVTDGRIDVARTAGATTTFTASPLWSMLLLRIDLVVIPGDWCVAGAREIHLAGSDHRGIVADIGRCTA